MKTSPFLKALIVSAGLLSLPVRADVLSVPGQFTTIQSAIDAAADFDVVLIAPGSYGEALLIADKAVSVVADGGTVTLAYLVVQDLAPGRTVVLRGLSIPLAPVMLPAIHLTDNLGAVRIEQCDFSGGFGSQPLLTAGKPGLWIESCASVNVSTTTLTGGRGADLVEEDTDGPAGPGGPGLFVRGSLVSVTDSTVSGGHGGDIYDTVFTPGGDGGEALLNIAGQVMVGGSTLKGGTGGFADCTYILCGSGGDGGSALHQQQPTAGTWLRGNVLIGGAPGANGLQGFGSPGVQQWIEAGSVTSLGAPWRSMSASSPAREGDLSAVAITATPGDQAFLWASLNPSHLPLIGKQGVFLLGLPALLTQLPLGAVPAAGSLSTPLLIPELGPGIEGISVHLQLVVIGDSTALIGPLSTLTLIDSAF